MSKKLKLSYERVSIEAKDPEFGYCYVNLLREGDDYYIRLDGNLTVEQAESEYPLCLCSDDEIDEFANKLKKILNS